MTAAGVESELERLYRSHATPLLRLGYLLTGNRTVAEDLVQEAFVRFYRSRSVRAGAELAYLRRTLVNLSHGHHRRLGVARRHERPQVNTVPAAETTAERRSASDQVIAAVRALPDRQRECIVLRFYADLTDAEIGAALAISSGSVKTHLHRARAALASSLESMR